MNLRQSRKLDRRDFLRLAGAASAAALIPSAFSQTSATATLTVKHKVVATMPLDFTGLSYESPQLANPAFFSPENKGLVRLCRELTPHGVLRTGGNLSAFTGWRDDPSVPLTAAEQAGIDKGKKYWEWDLCDPSVGKGNREAVFTPASIRTLAAFLDATGWKLIYGLNFGTGTPEQAAAEAACVQRIVGRNLLAFQLGNEVDFWNGGLRPKGWEFDVYYEQWKEWVRAIRARVPNAPMGGPDVAVRLDWMEKMAEREKNLAILSKHHYAMGPAGDPKMDAARLLGPDAEVGKEIASAQRAKDFHGVGFRTSECGSCYHGGQRGVSDAYASALWCADYMLTLAAGGHAGVNLHGGGDGIYSPIVGDLQRGLTARPGYFGMQFAQSFAGANFLETTLSSNANASAFAGESGGETMIAVVNKQATPVRFKLNGNAPPKAKLESVSTLSGPSLSSLSGVSFGTEEAGSRGRTEELEVPAYTAQIFRFKA